MLSTPKWFPHAQDRSIARTLTVAASAIVLASCGSPPSTNAAGTPPAPSAPATSTPGAGAPERPTASLPVEDEPPLPGLSAQERCHVTEAIPQTVRVGPLGFRHAPRFLVRGAVSLSVGPRRQETQLRVERRNPDGTGFLLAGEAESLPIYVKPGLSLGPGVTPSSEKALLLDLGSLAADDKITLRGDVDKAFYLPRGERLSSPPLVVSCNELTLAPRPEPETKGTLALVDEGVPLSPSPTDRPIAYFAHHHHGLASLTASAPTRRPVDGPTVEVLERRAELVHVRFHADQQSVDAWIPRDKVDRRTARFLDAAPPAPLAEPPSPRASLPRVRCPEALTFYAPTDRIGLFAVFGVLQPNTPLSVVSTYRHSGQRALEGADPAEGRSPELELLAVEVEGIASDSLIQQILIPASRLARCL